MFRLNPIHCSAAIGAAAVIAAPWAGRAAVASMSAGQDGSGMTLVANAMFNPAAPRGSSANPIPESSPTPYDLAYRLTPGDPNLITNGPIPDTTANRLKYGEPLSHAGRESAAVGN